MESSLSSQFFLSLPEDIYLLSLLGQQLLLSVVLLITLKERFFYFIDLTLNVRQVKMQFISQNWQVAKILPTPDHTDGPFSRHSWLPWGCWTDIRDTENHATMGLLMGERNHVGPFDVPYLCTYFIYNFIFLRQVPISLYRHTGYQCSPKQHRKLLPNFLSWYLLEELWLSSHFSH